MITRKIQIEIVPPTQKEADRCGAFRVAAFVSIPLLPIWMNHALIEGALWIDIYSFVVMFLMGLLSFISIFRTPRKIATASEEKAVQFVRAQFRYAKEY